MIAIVDRIQTLPMPLNICQPASVVFILFQDLSFLKGDRPYDDDAQGKSCHSSPPREQVSGLLHSTSASPFIMNKTFSMTCKVAQP